MTVIAQAKRCECPSCGRPLPGGTTECPYCGEGIPGNPSQDWASVVFLVLLVICCGLDLILSGTAIAAVFDNLRRLLTFGAAPPVILFALGTLLIFQPPSSKWAGMPTGVSFLIVAKELLRRILYLLVLLCASFFAFMNLTENHIPCRTCGIFSLAAALITVKQLHLGRRLYFAAVCIIVLALIT